ncbi:MAG: Maf family protein [Pseudomonadota bacterium]
MKRLILASASPRRTQILAQLGVDHEAMPADIVERRDAGETPDAYVLRMATCKASVIAKQLDDTGVVVLGADTTVALGDTVFGKPANQQEGAAMLQQLGGRTHRVLSAVAVLSRSQTRTKLVESSVTLRPISASEAACYWATGEPCDKAGGYAIQGKASAFVAAMTGSYSGVVGLPIFETLALLAAANIAPQWLSGATCG